MLLILVNFGEIQPACIENAVIAVLTQNAYLWFSFKSHVKAELDSSVLKTYFKNPQKLFLWQTF